MRTGSQSTLCGRSVLVALLLLPAAFQAQAQKDVSYDDTLAFIESVARAPLVERKHCEFIFKENLRFEAKALNPVPSVAPWGVVFSCRQGKLCIDPRKSDKLLGEITIEVREPDNAPKLGKAVSHLIKLCGGSSASADLF